MDRRLLLCAALALALLLPGCDRVTTKPEVPVLTGRVLDAGGHPVAEARVAVYFPIALRTPAGPLAVQHAPGRSAPADLVPVPVVPGVRSITLWGNPTSSGACRVNLSVVEASRVKVQIFPPYSTAVRTLADRTFPAGLHALVWDGTGDDGQPVPNGGYFVSFTESDSDSVFTFGADLLLDAPDPVARCNAIADVNGRFSIPLASLPIGRIIHATDLAGAPVGTVQIESTVDVWATAGTGASPPVISLTGVDLGTLRHSVAVTLRAP